MAGRSGRGCGSATPERQQGWIYWQLTALIGDLLLLIWLCCGLLLIDEVRDTGPL